MTRSVVDANVLIAARLANDQDHDRGLKLSQAFDQGDLPTAYVFSDVLEEVLNYLEVRASHEQAVRTLDALVESSGFEIYHTPKSDFDAGRSLFRKYERLSLTDAVIVAAMQREDLEHLYSFDDDFDVVDDVTRLTTPDDPTR